MEQRTSTLVALPIFLAMILIVCYSIISKSPTQSSSALSFKEMSDEYCGDCSDTTIADDCRNSSSGPVFGGLDFVEYFTDFRFENGTYDEDQVGSAGSSDYSYVFNGYTFYFKSDKNKKIFESNPIQYAPKWGGFCSWGVAGEFCPKYTWSADCLGPDGSWDQWTIVDGRLFFFKDSSPKAKFKNDTDYYVASGDLRWSNWFGSEEYSQYSTNCYTETSTS